MAFFKQIKAKLTDGQKNGWSLEARFITTFLMLLFSLLFAIWVVLAWSGAFDLNKSKTAAVLEHELNTLAGRIKNDFNTVTSYSIALSEAISRELQIQLLQNGIAPKQLSSRPELLTNLLDSLFPIVTSEIRVLKSSGVFLILDATVNPSLPDAKDSKSGLFIRNIAAQNNFSAAYYDLRYLCGPVMLARSRKMPLLPQWSLEFDISKSDRFSTVMKNAREYPDKALSQLYYWTEKESDGGTDYGMYCCVPIIIDNTVVGMCGYEISAMQFKVSYAPEVDGQSYSFCMLAKSDSKSIHFENAVFAGNYAVTDEQPYSALKKPSGRGLLTYSFDNGSVFVGNHTPLPLYSASSVYADTEFSVILLTPESQIQKINREINMRYIGGLFVLLLGTATATVILCRKNLKPVKKAIEEVRQGRLVKANKTRVRDIDDLFEFLSERDRESEEKLALAEKERKTAIAQKEQANAVAESYQEIYASEITSEQNAEFMRRLNTLTDKEKTVYNLYLQGKKAQDIADICGITINTVKYHNKNIYDKLGINSRKELLRYALSCTDRK